MNIVVFGAGAIGSFFGGVLSQKNNVALVGRKKHVNAICENYLFIKGKTNLKANIKAVENAKDIDFTPDLLILTVKSYDTEKAIKEASKIIVKDTIIMSLQNGIDNIDKIKKHVDSGNIVVGITTNGCVFSEPGIIQHTGIGKTVLGNIEGSQAERLVELFNASEIKTKLSNDILSEIWIKGIVNSSINPLTGFLNCKNGYLLENPLLENMVEQICTESTNAANANGLNLDIEDMIGETKEVIRDTSENYSSMLQSIKNKKKTEIDSINGKIIEIGKEKEIEVRLNELLVFLVRSLS